MEIIKTKKGILKFFENLNLEYIETNVSLYSGIKNPDLYQSRYYIDNAAEFIYLEEKYGEKLEKHLYSPTYIKKVNDQIGYGLFSSENIKADSLIGEYTGIIQEAHDLDSLDKETAVKTEYAWDYPDEIPGLPPLEINARYAGGPLRFVNHSFHPNLRIEHTVVDNEWKIFFVADENIEADAELFVDYGDAYWAVESREIIIP